MDKIVGMCRYGVLTSFKSREGEFPADKVKGGVQSYLESPTDIWSDSYFTRRLELFENITLRCLDLQTSDKFVFLVYHSDSIPSDKREKLIALENEHPYLINVFIKGKKLILPDKCRTEDLLTFRVDNDDGLPADYVSRLVEMHSKLIKSGIDTIITNPELILLARTGQNKFSVQVLKQMYNAVGIARYSPSGHTVIDAGHHLKMRDTEHPTEIMVGAGGLQIMHDSNVYNHFRGGKQKPPPLIEEFDRNQLDSFLNAKGYSDMSFDGLPLHKLDKVQIWYKGHAQNVGDVAVEKNGVVGTPGSGLRLEELTIWTSRGHIKAKTRASVRGKGPSVVVGQNVNIGTRGQKLPLESFSLELLDAAGYQLKYKVYQEPIGWSDWHIGGTASRWAGVRGKSSPIEAIQIELVPPAA